MSNDKKITDRKDLENMALTDEELSAVNAGFSLIGFFRKLVDLVTGKKEEVIPSNADSVICGITRPESGGGDLEVVSKGRKR